MAHVDNLRRHLPAVRHALYLDTGTHGPLPDATVEGMQQVLRRQLEDGRHHDRDRLRDVQGKVRDQLGHLLHVPPTSLALVDSTTHGLNIVLWGLPLASGDEILVTTAEHPGALLPVFMQRQRRGAIIKFVDGTLPADELCAAIERAMTSRTRVIVFSHVSYQTGHRLPVERIAQIARARGVYSVVDGAQGCGADPIDLGATDVDAYAFPGHKWLCGPDGTGALFVRADLRSVIQTTYAGMPTLAERSALNVTGTFLETTEARGYQHTWSGLAQWTGFLESLQFLRVTAGLEYVCSRIHGLSGHLLDQLLDVEGVHVLTPREARVGLIHFQIEQLSAARFVEEADKRAISIKVIAERQAVRVSTGFYNTEDELDRLVQLIRSAADL